MDGMKRLSDPLLPVWGLDEINIGQRDVHRVYPWHAQGYKGDGIRVAVIDAAVDPRVEYARNQMRGRLSYGPAYTTSLIDSHGQRVTQIVYSYAPNVEVFVLPYTAYYDDFLDYSARETSLQWCIDNDIDVINASISGLGRSGVIELSDFCIAAGITLVTSAGNTGASGFDPNDPEGTETTTFIGGLPQWISVANCRFSGYPDEESGDIIISPTSGIGPNVFTTAFGSYQFPRYAEGGVPSPTSGTSHSSPAITAMIALFMQRYKEKRGSRPSPELVREFVQENSHMLNGWEAEPMQSSNRSYRFGYGLFKMPPVGEVS